MAAHDDDMNRGIRPGRGSDDPAGQIAYLEQEIAVLRRKLADSPRHTRILEERIVELQTNLAGVSAQNERLANTLREARDQIVALKEEVDRLAQPPAGFGVFLQAIDASIAIGPSEACPRCGSRNIGSTGQLTLLLISQGFLGVALYFGFLITILLAPLVAVIPSEA